MKLILSYQFDRERDNVGAKFADGSKLGYVLPFSQRENPKLSFVANSGVKFGSTDGASAGVREIQIIDVNALVNMVDDAVGVIDKIDNFQFFDPKNVDPNSNDPTTGVHDDGKVKDMKATVPILPYQQLDAPKPTNPFKFMPPAGEDVGTLMHGVAYGVDYEKMMDFKLDVPRPLTPPFTWEDYWHALNHNNSITGGNSFEMVITWESQSYLLTVELNGDKRYEDPYFVPGNICGSIYIPAPQGPVPQNRDGHIYLQSHWGSGVVFTSAKFLPDQ